MSFKFRPKIYFIGHNTPFKFIMFDSPSASSSYLLCPMWLLPATNTHVQDSIHCVDFLLPGAVVVLVHRDPCSAGRHHQKSARIIPHQNNNSCRVLPPAPRDKSFTNFQANNSRAERQQLRVDFLFEFCREWVGGCKYNATARIYCPYLMRIVIVGVHSWGQMEIKRWERRLWGWCGKEGYTRRTTLSSASTASVVPSATASFQLGPSVSV